MRGFAALVLLVLSCGASAAQCTRSIDTGTGPHWQSWGNGTGNSRFTEQGLTAADLTKLQLRWSFGFPGVSSVVGNPVVHGNAIFIGVDSGDVYALDLDSGCVFWTFKAESGVRTAPAFASIDGRQLLFFGDRNANVHALDANSGQQLWQTKVETHQAAILTGSPQYVELAGIAHPHRLLVPVSSSEEGLAAVPTYNCCSFRGSLVSLDAKSGEMLWQSYPILTPAHATGEHSQGPSGGGIWSAPTVDVAGKRVFVATGDAYSAPADIATDAIVGLDLIDGHRLWVNQGTANDVWTVQCLAPNAPKSCGPDQDYGSPAMLVSANNRQFLVAGQKSGWIRAFAPSDGKLLWNTAVVANTEEFGGKVVWGGANDGRVAFFGLGSGGVVAVQLADGRKLWFTDIKPRAEQAAHLGQDGPLTVSNDILFTGGWDGIIRALATGDGKVLWQYDTAHDYTTTNGVSAKGGSLGAAGPVVAGKHLVVPSGYVGVKNGAPGNVLLMFAP